TSLPSHASHHVEFPEPAYDVEPEGNAEFAAGAYRFRYQSFVTPPSIFDYDTVARELRLLKRTEVLGGYDPTRYRSDRLPATGACSGNATRSPTSSPVPSSWSGRGTPRTPGS